MPLPILRCCSRLLRCCVARLCGLALSLSRLQMKQYAQHIDAAIEYALKHSDGKNKVEVAIDKLAVIFGAEITKIGALFVLAHAVRSIRCCVCSAAPVPGVVSTEVDARLSFDTQGSIEKARRLIALYKEMGARCRWRSNEAHRNSCLQGIDKDRILIKLAATWEGIKAAEQLEKEGIHCNLCGLLLAFPSIVTYGSNSQHAAVLNGTSDCLRRGELHSDFAIRRTHLRALCLFSFAACNPNDLSCLRRIGS